MLQNPTAYVDQKRLELDSTHNALVSRYERLVNLKKQKYIHYAASLDALSPLKVLGRGYSITTDENGSAVSSAEAVGVGDKLNVHLKSGALKCSVDEIILGR